MPKAKIVNKIRKAFIANDELFSVDVRLDGNILSNVYVKAKDAEAACFKVKDKLEITATKERNISNAT